MVTVFLVGNLGRRDWVSPLLNRPTDGGLGITGTAGDLGHAGEEHVLEGRVDRPVSVSFRRFGGFAHSWRYLASARYCLR